MAVQWQRDLPIAKESVVNPKRQKKELARSAPFSVKDRPGSTYELLVTASWADDPKNGSNAFHCSIMAVVAGSSKESEYVCVDDAPVHVEKNIRDTFGPLLKWNGCHPFGPWSYIENTVYLAGSRDFNGLLAGERRQIVNGRTKELAWHQVAVDADGNEIDLYKLDKYADGPTPPVNDLRLEWRPWCRVGDGKARELDAARRVAIWPDATDEQLCSDNLEELLKERLPALLVEFRGVIEGLGFTW